MRILIFSDLHANLAALAALQRVEQKPDALFFLGDVVGYGPDPTACAAWLRQNVTHAIQGDHDLAAATGADCASPVEWLELAHATRDMNRALMPRHLLDHLGALPTAREIEMDGAKFFLTHRPLRNLEPLTSPDVEFLSAFENSRADVFMFGHTHIPLIRRVNQKYFVNPGSLGQPRHGLPSATYAVWNDGDLKIQHIDYDPQPTIQRLALVPLDPEHVTRLQETLARGM